MTQWHTAMRVVAVDDNEGNLELLEQMLGDAGYTNVTCTRDSSRVPALCASSTPDLVLLDLHMPRMSGFDVLTALQPLLAEPESLPVLVLTADATLDARHRALSLGARDFVTKPIDQVELLLRVHSLLQTRHLQRQLRERNDLLEIAVRARTAELEDARLEGLRVLARTAEYHDDETHRHTQRVGRLASRVAAALGCSADEVATIGDAAPLHDVGKVGVSKRILLKPGRLNDEERSLMMRHVEIGARILEGTRSPVLRTAREIVRYHHERWDGAGYLLGLRGEEIPLAARITAIADVFDALTHERPYKPAWEIDRALEEIVAGSGTAFDPRVVQALCTLDADTLEADGHPDALRAAAVAA